MSEQNGTSSEQLQPDVQEEKTEVVDTPKENSKNDKQTILQDENTIPGEDKKANAAAMEVTSVTSKPNELEKKIIRQIEYYFGDVNLAKDKFFQTQVKENADGWITMETMLNCNRLKEMSDESAIILAAMEKSTTGLMEISEDRSKIRRSPDKPMPENNKERNLDLKQRSLYVKGFPTESTLEDLLSFFDKHGGSEQVLMRRHRENDNKAFKGSVFVIFTKAEDCEKFVKAEEMKYTDNVLEIKYKHDYMNIKTEKTKQDKEQKMKDSEEAKRISEEEQRKKEESWTVKGAVLKVSGLPEDLKMYDMKTKFNEWGKVNWVDYEENDNAAKVRYDGEGSAAEALEKGKKLGDGTLKINDTELKGEVLEGEEEKQHWDGVFAGQREARANRGRGDRGGGGGGGGRGGSRGRGGGRGGGRGTKRHFGRSNDEPTQKKVKDE